MSLHTILIIEDDPVIQRMLRRELGKEGFVVYEAVTLARAADILGQYAVDFILLDLFLPDGSGLGMLPNIRTYTRAPVIVVSGEESPARRVECLAQGADDYVVKPFDISELVARIRVHLRRHGESRSGTGVQRGKALETAKIMQFGSWTLDCARYCLYDQDNCPADLTASEFRLLETLVRKPAQVLSRAELGDSIREDGPAPTHRAIDIKITRIRKKLGEDAADPRVIKTVRGVGYMFDTDVAVVE